MGIYRAIARPLLFTLPPEASHRLAGALLGLPLPWRAIGGVPAGHGLATDLAGIPVPNPVGLAAGFDKSCAHLDSFGHLGFGYAVGGTVTRHPRRGNPRPRIVRDPAAGSLTNAMGLPNPGAEEVARILRRRPRAGVRCVSMADEGIEDAVRTHRLLEPLVDAVELNVGCPNVSWGRDRDNEAHLAELLGAIGGQRRKPLIVKLPPFESSVEREVVLALARIAQEAGVDGLTCGNSRPVADRRLAVGRGGVSGAPLASRTPSNVAAVVAATGGELAVNACGGIFGARDAIACLEAGARTVQLYTGLVYMGPRVVASIVRGLTEALDRRAAPDPAGLAVTG